MKPTVNLTCAVTGNAPPHPKHPKFPITPAEICDAVVEAARAGASAAHIHVRDPQTGGGSRDPALFREVVDRIRSTGVDIVLNLSAGLGGLLIPDAEDESRAGPGSDVISAAARMAHVENCLPEIASLDVTTSNQAEAGIEFVYLNTTRTLRAMAKRFHVAGVKPELEVFGPGDILFARQMIEEKLIETPPLFQFVLGVPWCAPADVETMVYLKRLLPQDAIWGALGIGRLQMPVVALSTILGGNVRVGLEDNLYLDRGVFATNGQLVERGRTIIENIGYQIATPEQMRATLALRHSGSVCPSARHSPAHSI
jgi:uncharacterized protein (DUF849 family)